MPSMSKIHVTIWNEYRHEKTDRAVSDIYPKGIHGAIKDFLDKEPDMAARLTSLDEKEQGLPESLLDETDVLIWWSHIANDEVSEEAVSRVQKRVLSGMGFICLHSAHLSKVFTRLMGTSGSLTWREANERERLWNINPAHPITRDLGQYFELPHTEMYGEPFGIPEPDQLLFISWFEGGEVFRSGCTWQRGNGKIFYFRPGHETLPIYYDKNVRKVITAAVRWAAPGIIQDTGNCPNRVTPLETIG